MDADPNPVVFMKMSGFYYGSKAGYYDQQASRNYNNAIRLGKVPGLYHFAGGGDPIAEADWFIGACSPLAEGDIMILDYELTGSMNPPADPAEWCWQFVNRVHERTGTWPLFYTYTSMLNQYGFNKVLQQCGLWLADYRYRPEDDIPGVPPYIIHQFQGSPLDTNACFIPLDVLKRYSYHVPVAPSPEVPHTPETPPPAPEPVPPTQPDIPDTKPPEPTPTPEPTPEPPVPTPTPTPVEDNVSIVDLIKKIVQWIRKHIRRQK